MVLGVIAPLALGGISAISSAASGRAQQRSQQAQAQAEWDYRNAVAQEQYRAQKRAHKDGVRFQKASTRYAEWSADFQARYQRLGDQYAYWQQTLNWNQQRSYIQSLRNVELSKAIKQAQVVRETRAAAARDYMLQSEALSHALQEEAVRDSIAVYQYQAQAAKAGAELIAVGQSGATIDRMVGDYARQVGDMKTLMGINEGFRQRQFTREQAAQVAGYMSQYNSQEFYEKQPYLTPIKPFPPLPTLVIPPPPTSTGPGPSAPLSVQPGRNTSGSASILNAGNAILSGVSTGLGAWQQLSQFTSPAPGIAPSPVSSFGGGLSGNFSSGFSGTAAFAAGVAS